MKTVFFGATSALLIFSFSSCSNNSMKHDATGVFEATEVTLSAKTQGEIVSLVCEEGDEVTAGQSLGLIDTTMLSLQKKALLANMSATDARRLDVSSQVASLKQQKANIEQEMARFTRLLQKGAASQKQVDDLNHQIAVVQKQITALNDQVSSTNRSIGNQSSAIEAQVEQIQKQLHDCSVSSPIEGVILNKYAEQGEYAAPGKALLKIGDLKRIRLRAYVTAPQLTNLKLGQKVKVFADLGEKEQKEYEGTLTWISDKAEFTPKTIQTRDERANLVYAVKISVENDGTIKCGMYGNVDFGQ